MVSGNIKSHFLRGNHRHIFLSATSVDFTKMLFTFIPVFYYFDIMNHMNRKKISLFLCCIEIVVIHFCTLIICQVIDSDRQGWYLYKFIGACLSNREILLVPLQLCAVM